MFENCLVVGLEHHYRENAECVTPDTRTEGKLVQN